MKKHIVFLLFSAVAFIASAVEPIHGHAMPKAYFLKEDTDCEWSISITSEIISLGGIYVMVVDSNGRMVAEKEIPNGKYSTEKPFVIRIPKDGVTGEYTVKILGAQYDFTELNMPLSTLPEVYSGVGTIGHDPNRKIIFRPRPGEKEIQLCAYKGDLTVKEFESGKVVADTKNPLDGTKLSFEDTKKRNLCVTFPVEQGIDYLLIPQSFYLRSGNVIMTFVPGGWFEPDKKIEAVKWWEAK